MHAALAETDSWPEEVDSVNREEEATRGDEHLDFGEEKTLTARVKSSRWTKQKTPRLQRGFLFVELLRWKPGFLSERSNSARISSDPVRIPQFKIRCSSPNACGSSAGKRKDVAS